MKAKDLAKKLGVSPATISLVLNNKPGISDSLRKSLLEKIQELGHEEMLCDSCRSGEAPGAQPAKEAAQVQEGGCACKVIAYIISDDFYADRNDPYNFFSGVLEGVEAEAWENDCCLVMVHTNRLKNVTLAEQLRRTGNVVGAIVHPCRLTKQLERDIKAADIPFVFMDGGGFLDSSGSWEPSSVCISNRQGMYQVIRYLKAKGHTEIGFVNSGWQGEVQLDRFRWYQAALRAFGITERPEYNYCAGKEKDLFEYQELARLFAAAPQLPTALVCEGDRQAWQAIKALEQIGLRVPKDISVTGFDDQPLCTMIEPRITTIRNSPQLMGRECVLMIKNLRRLKALGEEAPWLRIELPARLIERDSVQDLREKQEGSR